ncbi:putative chromate transport protein [Burkholderiales bacterium]|nr:putative chromate transport protein [Burkholderiales bacterium]
MDRPPAPKGAPGRPAAPSRAEAFRFWLKLGFVSFGGPAGQIAIMHRELVDRRRWISERRFLHALNYCMLLPGPEATQLATYLGWLMHRTWGGIVAGALFVLPSLAILIALSWIYMSHGHVPAIAGALAGVKPIVVAIVLHAAWRIGRRTLHHPWLWAIAIGAFVALEGFDAPFPAIVAAAALAGFAGSRLAPRAFSGGGGHASSADAHPPAVIDDDTPPPAHARWSRGHFAVLVATFVAIWAAAIAALAAATGAHGSLAAMAWLFSKAALVTFGGAYAVLPYIVQNAVEHHGWLTAAQMIDGLALGETTPGPLIMVVAFVGFVASWTQAPFGPDAIAAAGIAGAVVATFFTFLPSFLFILAGAPLVETTHGDVRVTAPLAGITAAVVGVIASLAVFFAAHVFWPGGFAASRPLDGLDVWGVATFAVALVALFRFGVGMIPLVFAGAAAGLARVLAG